MLKDELIGMMDEIQDVVEDENLSSDEKVDEIESILNQEEEEDGEDDDAVSID